MRNLIAAAVLLTVAFGSAIACSCGGGGYAGGGSLGMLSQYHSNLVGLYWGHRMFESRASGLESVQSHFQFNSIEATGKYFPHKRIFVAGILPYRFNHRAVGNTSDHLNGLGDITLSGGYLALRPSEKSCRVWTQTLSLGAGLKMPTGKNDASAMNLSDTYLQPGTGSWDVLFNAAYTFKIRLFGVMAETNYSVNTANRQHVKLGNRASASASGFYSYRKEKVSIIPSAGVAFENAAMDEIRGVEQSVSGGNLLFATASLNAQYGKAGMGFGYQHPAWQQIAGDLMRSNPRWMLQAYYIF